LDHAAVQGNGTLFEGSLIETGRNPGTLELSNGITMRFGSDSRGKIYRDHMVLERGAGEVEARKGFHVQTGILRVASDGDGGYGRVTLHGANKVQVASVRGNLRVTNEEGVLIAALRAGSALEFEPQGGGASAPASLTGCLVKQDGHYYLTDETARVTVELKGGRLEKLVGHKIEVTGAQVPAAVPAGSATQVIQVSDTKDAGKGCSGGAALAAAGGAAAGGAAAGGAAGATGAAVGAAVGTKAVLAGVIVAAAATGTAVAVTSDEETLSK
jgi:hypothetical protein